MAIVTNTAHRIEIPHEQSEENGGPHHMVIRFLSGSEMDEAATVKSTKVLETVGPLMKDIQQTQANQTEEEKAKSEQEALKIESRRQAYDPGVLIKHALISWSYPEEIPEHPGQVLDAVTRDWLWSLIVEENSRPPLSLGSGEHNSNSAESPQN